MASAKDVLKTVQKDFGQSVASLGVQFVDVPRLPTGILPFDIQTGGGFPMGKVSEVFGPESSGKTNLILKAIGQGQKIYPDKVAVFVDAEFAFDPIWAAKLGVDCDRIILCQPDSAEQAVDLVEAFCYADDVFAVAVDSLAALVSNQEINNSAEKAVVGGASLTVGKLMRKAVLAMGKSQREHGFSPALLCVNQIRHKIGVMFGDPETTPGGNAPRFAASLRVRVYGKNEMDKKVHATIPAVKHTNVILRKWKVPIVAMNSEYKMLMLDSEAGPAGSVPDWNTLASYMKELGYLGKSTGKGGGWVMMGKEYPTLAACKESLDADFALGLELRRAIIAELVGSKTIAPQEGEPDGIEALGEAND